MTMHRREQALKGLPGPKHPLIFGMMVDLVCRRDPHRYATELAERYGPIFKFRLLIFHVSPTTARPCTIAHHRAGRMHAPRMHALLPRGRRLELGADRLPVCHAVTKGSRAS